MQTGGEKMIIAEQAIKRLCGKKLRVVVSAQRAITQVWLKQAEQLILFNCQQFPKLVIVFMHSFMV